MGEGNMLGKIVGLTLAAIMIGVLFIQGLQILAAADTTNITGPTLVLVGLIGLFITLALIIMILRFAGVKIDL